MRRSTLALTLVSPAAGESLFEACLAATSLFIVCELDEKIHETVAAFEATGVHGPCYAILRPCLKPAGGEAQAEAGGTPQDQASAAGGAGSPRIVAGAEGGRV